VAASDGTWTLILAEDRRSEILGSLPIGAQILRLERQRIALEDWFVNRIRATHGAGVRLGELSQG
jgi:hypothetical protein